jgi:hypothetical protein
MAGYCYMEFPSGSGGVEEEARPVTSTVDPADIRGLGTTLEMSVRRLPAGRQACLGLGVRVGRAPTKLQRLQKPVILVMAPDPEPRDLVLLDKSERAICQGHPYGVGRFSLVNLLEVQAGMLRVITKQTGRLAALRS